MKIKRRKFQQQETNQNIIANMGLFWRREKVRWHGNKKLGRMLAGRRQYGKRKGIVDFWHQTGIYALYADYRLLYVGQAGLSDKSCIGSRLKQHLTDDLAGRWNMFSWFGFQKVNQNNKLAHRSKIKLTRTSHLSNIIEGIIIEIAEPPLNNQKGKFGKKVERYLQYDDTIRN